MLNSKTCFGLNMLLPYLTGFSKTISVTLQELFHIHNWPQPLHNVLNNAKNSYAVSVLAKMENKKT